MRIVQINSVPFGSTGAIATRLSQAMTERGIENRLFYGIGKSPLPQAQKFGGFLSLRAHQLLTRTLDRHGLGSLFSTESMIEALREYAPDLIHLHNLHGFYLHYPLLFRYLKETRVPVIWTMHDCWAFTGHCAHFEQCGCEKYKTGCGKCPALGAYPKSWLIDASQKNWQLKKNTFANNSFLEIVTPSMWLKDRLSESFLNDTPVRVIRNGIDLSVFCPPGTPHLRASDDPITYLGVAPAWTTDKGYDDFLRMEKLLAPNETLCLVGAGPMYQSPKLKRVAATANQKELVSIYQNADVFVNPTRCDTFPTVNMEAIACGLPIATYQTGGSPEIADEKTGFCVQTGDYSALLSAARTLAARRNAEQVTACRQRATEFSEEKQTDTYLALYAEKLGVMLP